MGWTIVALDAYKILLTNLKDRQHFVNLGIDFMI